MTRRAGTNRRRSAMPAQGHEVSDDRIQLAGADLVLGKRGHRAQAIAHLELDQESGDWNVVQRRTESRFAARMTLLTVAQEREPASRHLRRGDRQRAGDGLAAA